MTVYTHEISYLGYTKGRGQAKRFGIRQADRLSHLYMVGRTGVGKSTLIEWLARQDLAAERGFALLDPHGDLAERVRDVARVYGRPITYLDPSDPTLPYGYNPLRRVAEARIPLAAAGLLETLKKLWPEAWGVRMEHVLRNTFCALLERKGSTLPDVLRLYDNAAFRAAVVPAIRNATVRRFWSDEFMVLSDRARAELVAPIRNKLGALLTDPRLYRVLVTPKIQLRFRPLMDEGGVLVVNLSKGLLGEDSANVLGSLLLSTLGHAALSRADGPAGARRPFIIYADEFQTFATLSFANQLAELRKYGVGLVLANQHLSQIMPAVRQAILGNIGTLISFRVGAEDAPLLARELCPVFGVEDLLNLPNRHIYVKLMIDGTPSRPFSATTSPSTI